MDTQQLREIITANRPTLKDNTVKSYISILKSVYHQVYPEDTTINIDKFNDTKKFLDYLMENFDPSVRKQYLSTLVVLTENDEYREQMMKDVTWVNDHQTHEPNQKQKDNFLTATQINALLKTLKSQVKPIYDNKSYTPENLITLQNYVMVNLFCGKFIPPRRSLDYTAFKVRNIDKEKDNYLDNNFLVFNQYKTSSTYGQQRVLINKTLQNILNKYIKVIPESQEYLLFSVTAKPLSSVSFNQRWNRIFNAPISTNQWRHFYLSHHYQNHIGLEQDLIRMGTSKAQLSTYIQRGDFR
jgi:integrase